MTVVNYDELRGRIRTVCKTEGNFAKKMGVSGAVASKLLRGEREWRRNEIDKASSILNLSPEKMHAIFFA